tara:strand:- start:2015 stop:3133 length:1119 start_codon:yes stop_codon:yes gene_type:complete
MKNFIANIARFFIPLFSFLFLLMLLPLTLLIKSDEIINPDVLIKSQIKEKKLLGMAYTYPTGYIKLQNTLTKKPEVLALGSSRIMNFRSFFFNAENDFYNAGGAVQSINGFNLFLNELSQYPKLIIINIDQFWFNPNFNDPTGLVDLTNSYSSVDILMDSYKRVYFGLLSSKINLEKINGSENNIGMNAIMYDEGFRDDGSYQYSRIISSPKEAADYLFSDTFDRIEKGNRRFEYGNIVSQKNIEELNKFLKICENKNIHVVAFLAPFAPSVWDKLVLNESNYEYIFKLDSKLSQVFKNYKHNFFNFEDISKIGVTDLEVIDGVHVSDKASLKMIIEMCKTDSTLLQYCDLEKMSELLNNSYSNLELIREVK